MDQLITRAKAEAKADAAIRAMSGPAGSCLALMGDSDPGRNPGFTSYHWHYRRLGRSLLLPTTTSKTKFTGKITRMASQRTAGAGSCCIEPVTRFPSAALIGQTPPPGIPPVYAETQGSHAQHLKHHISAA